MARQRTNPADDLGSFLIAEYLNTRNSLRDIAIAMGVSRQNITDILNRLETYFQATLIEREKNAREAKLTPVGQELVERVKNCLSPIHPTRTFRVKLAHSLMQSRLLLSILRKAEHSVADFSAEQSNLSSRTMELDGGLDLDDARETTRLTAQ